MLEHKFKTVRELKDALNECPDDAEIDISELPNNISRHGLTTVFDGKKVLICEYHDYEIINKYHNIFSELSKTEQSRCGCVYEMYQRNLSTAIDGYLSELTQEDKIKVIQLARAEFDYISPEEITEAIRQNQEDGYCSHGLDPNCCPLGCGDI